MRDMFCDGASRVLISSISMVLDAFDTFGLPLITSTSTGLILILRSSLLYDVVGGSSNAFFATWPLVNRYLGAD